MSRLDAKLFAAHLTTGYTEAEWREIAAHVVGKLEAFLGQPVTASGMSFSARGFNGDIDGSILIPGRLELSWFGRIGVDVLGHDEETALQAFIFLRGAGKRLVTIDGKSHLYLRYQESSPGEFGWTTFEWDEDTFGEYERWE